MRVKIDFYINDNFKFEKSLNEAMTAFIYRCIKTDDEEYSKRLHDIGFGKSGYKKFVYHTYALTQNNKLVNNILNKGIATLIFSSALENTIIKFTKGLIKIGKVQLLSHSFYIKSIENIKDNNINEGIFKIISPIFMASNNTWLKPSEMEDCLVNNLITKYNSLYNKLPHLNTEIKFLNSKAYYAYYKKSTMKAYFGNIAIKGDKEIVQLAYQSGIGSKNGIGLGLIEKI